MKDFLLGREPDYRYRDKSFLVEKLIKQHVGVIPLSTELGVCKKTLLQWCKKYNIYSEVLESRKTPRIGKELRNKKFGSLTVQELGKTDKHGKVRWVCKCDCGRLKLINAASLTRGLSKTCGYCIKWNFTGYGDVSGSWFRKLIENAKTRGIDVSITITDVWKLYEHQRRKCALTGLPIVFCRYSERAAGSQTASVDRIDSSRGYVLGNIQIIHKRLNRMKNVMGNEEFLAWCSLVCTHNKPLENPIKFIKIGWNER